MINTNLHVINENPQIYTFSPFSLFTDEHFKILSHVFPFSKNIALHMREFSDRLQYYIVFDLKKKKLNRNRMPRIHLDTHIGTKKIFEKTYESVARFFHTFFSRCDSGFFSFMMNNTREGGKREKGRVRERIEEGKIIFMSSGC
jgi:hypothetical protein